MIPANLASKLVKRVHAPAYGVEGRRLLLGLGVFYPPFFVPAGFSSRNRRKATAEEFSEPKRERARMRHRARIPQRRITTIPPRHYTSSNVPCNDGYCGQSPRELDLSTIHNRSQVRRRD